MAIKQYPEFSKNYPAIDGISKDERPNAEKRARRLKEKPTESISYRYAERAIRSDVEKILGMDDVSFNSWYGGREKAILDLLDPLRVIATVPELRYPSEEHKDTNLNAHSSVSSLRQSLEAGLEYLQVIKKVRDEQR